MPSPVTEECQGFGGQSGPDSQRGHVNVPRSGKPAWHSPWILNSS